MPLAAVWTDPETARLSEGRQDDEHRVMSPTREIQNVTQMDLSAEQTRRHGKT